MSGDPQPVDTGSGITIRYLGRQLYPPRKPVESAERRIEAVPMQANTLYFVPSPLLFYGIDRLASALPSTSHILCIETDQKLMALSIEMAPKSLVNDRRISYARTESVAVAVSMVERLGLSRFRRCVSLPVSGGYALNRETYDAIYGEIEYRIREHWQNNVTLLKMGRLWMRNLLRNMVLLSIQSRPLNGSIDDPIVVVGAGESLEELLPVIKRYRDRFLLMAVDTALPTLSGADLSPDIVVVLEAQPLNYLDFLPDSGSTHRLLCDISSYPGILRKTRGPKHFFLSRFAECAIFDRIAQFQLLPELIPALGSVGIASVHLALAITRGIVLMGGIDFSYTSGKPHARGAPSHALSLGGHSRVTPIGWHASIFQRPRLRIPDKNGVVCETDVIMEGYRHTLSQMISDSTRVYDISPFGLSLTDNRLDKKTLPSLLTGRIKPLPKTDEPKPPVKEIVDRSVGFLQAEEHLLRRLLDLSRDSLTFGKSENKEELSALLSSLDYIYLDFPDRLDAQQDDPAFLSRCLISASNYLSEIHKAIEIAVTFG